MTCRNRLLDAGVASIALQAAALLHCSSSWLAGRGTQHLPCSMANEQPTPRVSIIFLELRASARSRFGGFRARG